MNSKHSQKPFWIAAIIGVALWIAASLTSGKREAWDSAVYWAGAYPLALAACAYLGYRFPERTWRWPVALFGAQVLPLAIISDGIGSLWVLGAVFLGVLALPGIVLAKIASRYGSVR